MPTYNCSRYLPEAIESVLRQSYSDFEFIIIDDCSTDNSVELIGKYVEKDKRITLRVNERNVGQAKNLNLCLNHAKGDYIKFVFSDDVLVSDKSLEKLVSVLDKDHKVALVTTARYLIDEKSNILKMLSEYEETITCSGTDIIKECLLEQKNKIGEPTAVLFRRKYAVRGFNEKYNQNVDWEMWLHILEQGKFAYIHEPLCSFRTHPNQQTKLNVKKQVHLIEPFYLLQDYGKKPYINFSVAKRTYIEYVPAFEIWKYYKKYRRITMRSALEKIHVQYGIAKFFVLYPMYKLYKGYLSAMRRISKFAKRCLQ
jgi:glycosyltransferase involved in cell wall biosynthesis